jgi:hypothetical protein
MGVLSKESRKVEAEMNLTNVYQIEIVETAQNIENGGGGTSTIEVGVGQNKGGELNSLELNKNSGIASLAHFTGNEDTETAEDTEAVQTDEDGNEIQPRWGKKAKSSKIDSGSPQGRLVARYIKLYEEHRGEKPLMGKAGVVMASRALNAGGLTENQVTELLEDWFASDRSAKYNYSITAALSDNNINRFKAGYQVS